MRMPRGEYSRGGAKSDWRGGVGRSFPPDAAFASQLKKLRARVRKDADRTPSAGSFGSNDGDLDQQTRVRQLSLDAGPAGQVLALGPGIPGFVHGVAQADVGDPDGGRYHLRLIGAAQLEEAVDFLENLLGLALGILLGVGGGDAGGEHEAIGLDDLGVDFRRLVARDGHWRTP